MDNLNSGLNGVVDIGNRLEPLVDEWLVESRQGVTPRLHQPVKQERAFEFDRPWEGPACGYATVLQDEKKIRLYYRGLHASHAVDESPNQATCYAESQDGIHFHRPELKLYDLGDGNNVIYLGPEAHNFTPFLDSNPAVPASEKFKAVGGVAEGLYAFASPDGIHWKKLNSSPIITRGELDSQNVPFWDEHAQLYRCYARYFDTLPHGHIRSIWSMTSRDFIHWSEPLPNIYGADDPREHFYTNATVPMPNAPHILLSFPTRFVPERKKIPSHPMDGVSDAAFMSSRDGVHWDRTFKEAWIRPGRDEKNWTDRNNMTARGILQTSPEEFSLYVSEHYRWPTSALRRYTVRRDGFASLNAGYPGGEWTTRPLIIRGRELILNFSTSAVGFIQVEVQDQTGLPLPGYELSASTPLFGDELDAPVRWQTGKDLESLQGQVVKFRFVMRDADLFSLRLPPN